MVFGLILIHPSGHKHTTTSNNTSSRRIDIMVRAWYMDDSPEDQRLEHHLDPPQFVTLEDLAKITGVTYWKVRQVSQRCLSALIGLLAASALTTPTLSVCQSLSHISFHDAILT